MDAVVNYVVEHYVITTVFVICCIAFIRYHLNRWLAGGHCHSIAQLDRKTVIVTGSNSGIGKEAARDFIKRGARVILACRNMEKAKAAAEEIEKEGRGEVIVRQLDLSSFKSIRKFADEILATESQVHILVNNAGISGNKGKTEDGFDLTFGTNHLGTFLLTNLLLERLKESAPARIVTVASIVHKIGNIYWDDLNLEKPTSFYYAKTYCQSKLANVLFTQELARRLRGTGVTAYCLHPGAVWTNIGRDLPSGSTSIIGWWTRRLGKNTVQGAQTTIYCAVDESIADESGFYYSDCKKITPAKRARDTNAAKRLWQVSEKLVGLN